MKGKIDFDLWPEAKQSIESAEIRGFVAGAVTMAVIALGFWVVFV